MQNGLYEVRVPDATDYWMEMVKCRHACPVHTDACGYVTSIAEGRYEDAYRIARAHNPVRLHLRARLRRALRSRLPPRRCRCAGQHTPAQALRHQPLRSGDRRLRALSRGQQRSDAAARSRRLRARRRGRRRRQRPHRGARPGQDRLQGHRLRKLQRAGRHADRRSPGLPPAARTGAPRDPGHPLAGRGTEVQHAPGPRFHHRQPAPAKATPPSSSASACPKGASSPSPAPTTRT